MKDVFRASGAGHTFARQMRGWVEEAGYEDGHERLVDVYLVAMNPNQQLAKQSTASTTAVVAGLVEYPRG